MSNKNKNFDLKPQTGFLHKSTNKTEEQSPDFFGSMQINGTLYDLAGWKKQGEKSGVNFISLNLDVNTDSIEEKEATRKGYIKDFKADKKKKENKDSYLLIKQTGTLHPQSDATKKEDFFGKVMLENLVYIKGFAIEVNNKPVIRLEVSDGMKSKEERTEITGAFMD